MKENQTHIFYLNGLPKCKMYFSIAMMFFLLYIGLEKVIQTFSMSGWIFGVFRWWFLGTGIAVALASIIYFAIHKKLTLAVVDVAGITCPWGMLWNRKKVEVTWDVIRSSDFGFIHKKWVVDAPIIPVKADFGNEEKVIKIILKEPLNSILTSQIETIIKQWWDGPVKVNNAGTEIYLREEPYGGYEPLLIQIRKHIGIG
jgi:hypothetical protein